jgi:glycosyltransferase involved in cell wall biosynthesis
VWYREWIKSRRVRRFDVALVGSQSHADYLYHLGMPEDKVFRGYNVVDNHYFSEAAGRTRSNNVNLAGRPCFLASNRFVPIKNLDSAIRAYALFLSRVTQAATKIPAWDLCLLGDGPLRESVEQTAVDLGCRVVRYPPWEDQAAALSRPPTVYFPGFRQIDELPKFYAYASAFFHPAVSEPWGLVINEAMASGLPILSSNNVAAAEELVDEGVNGYLFDPASVSEMADRMLKLSQLDFATREAMGEASLRIVNDRAPTKAFGDGLAAALRRMGWET